MARVHEVRLELVRPAPPQPAAISADTLLGTVR